MSTISDISENPLAQYVTTQNTATSGNQKLGQEDFLKLLTTQMRYQDPFNSQDSSALMGQLAQFGTVDGVQGIQNAVSELSKSIYAGQALQASSMVGHKVQVLSDSAQLKIGEGMQGAVKLTAPTDQITVTIRDSAGTVVKRISLGAADSGLVDFKWDGISDDGQPMPEGNYQISAQGLVNGSTFALQTAATQQVTGVALNEQGNALSLNVTNVGDVSINNIIRVL